MTRYNPFLSAFQAATAELTSTKAQQYYSMRAQQDTQAVIDTALYIGCRVYEAAVITYQFGQFCRALVETLAQEPAQPQLCLAAAPAPIALLPAAIQPHPDHTRWARRAAKAIQYELPSSGEVIAIPGTPNLETACKQLIASIEATNATLADPADIFVNPKPSTAKRRGRPRKAPTA